MKMNLSELISHLENECNFTLFECNICGMNEERGIINEKHKESDCIRHL